MAYVNVKNIINNYLNEYIIKEIIEKNDKENIKNIELTISVEVLENMFLDFFTYIQSELQKIQYEKVKIDKNKLH